MEPYRLREWRVETGRLFTCGRPGRSSGTNISPVPMRDLRNWVKNLPKGRLVIVSLLGKKPNGTSEYLFYPFRGGFDSDDRDKPTFQEWLSQCYPDQEILVCEHPTEDFRKIPNGTLEAVEKDINSFLERDMTVILMDSGGETRTRSVCGFLKVKEKF